MAKDASKIILSSNEVSPTQYNLKQNSAHSGDTAEHSPYDYVKGEIELEFVLLNQQQATSYFQGVLVGGPTPLVFQLEQA